MRRIISAFAITCAALLLTSAIAGAQGQVVDSRLTNVTFSAPVSVPGKTLAAGTYHFQLADSQANRNIVQIFDKDNNLVATMLAVPAKRQQAAGDPVITFKETRSSLPPAVHFWYYAGEKTGSDRVYPKAQAIAIARASGESVMSTDTDSTDLKNSKITSVSPAEANAQPTQTATTTMPTTTAEEPTRPTTTAPETTQQNPTQRGRSQRRARRSAAPTASNSRSSGSSV